MALDLHEMAAELVRMRRKTAECISLTGHAAAEWKDHHIRAMEDQTEKLHSLQDRKATLQLAAEHNKQRLQDEEQEQRRVRDNLAETKLRAEAVDARLKAAQQNLEARKEEYHRRLTEFETVRAQKAKQLEYNRSKVEQFASRFGLRVEQGKGEMRLVMTQVDPRDHDREFVLGLRYEDNAYQVTKCEPMVAALEDITAELNRTNDLRSFVKAVRGGFKHVTCEAVQGL